MYTLSNGQFTNVFTLQQTNMGDKTVTVLWMGICALFFVAAVMSKPVSSFKKKKKKKVNFGS